jgi:hypothetical protein
MRRWIDPQWCAFFARASESDPARIGFTADLQRHVESHVAETGGAACARIAGNPPPIACAHLAA